MEITRVATDAVNETIVMKVVHMDYKGQVQKRINEKMPLATVKGFRKGQVPKDLVAKQYGKAIKIEEVNKVVKLALEQYLKSNYVPLLGTPLEKVNENRNWDDEEQTFEFEIGLVPFIELSKEPIEITKLKVLTEESVIEKEISNIQKQYGNRSEADTIDESSEIEMTFINEALAINNTKFISLSEFKDDVKQQFIGKKVEESIVLNTKNLFDNDHKFIDYFGVSHDLAHGLDIDVTFVINKINQIEPAVLNQELYDKVFGEGVVNSEEELKEFLKAEYENYYAQQADQKVYDDLINAVIEANKFELPKEFLMKWMQQTGEKKLSETEAITEYIRTEKSLRFQLIESKFISENEIKINFDDIKSYTDSNIRYQMSRYGNMNPTDEEVQGIVAKVLSKQEEVQRISQEVMKQKALEMIKNNATIVEKEVSIEEYVNIMYGH